MKTIGFFVRHFTERGTEVSLYDYADYNEKLLGNKSIIFCFTPQKQIQIGFPTTKTSYEKFKSRFQIIEINDFNEINGIDIFYTQTHGGPDIYFFNSPEWKRFRTIKHCVFVTTSKEADVYIPISDQVNNKHRTNYPVLPYMVCVGNSTENLRQRLNIPDNAIVYGRHGGSDTFDVQFVKEAIVQVASANKYFLFMNTPRFCNLPNVIFLEGSADMEVKKTFVNTCDAFLHGRRDGETFGLSIAEFAICLKPIMAWSQCTDDAHFQILGDKIIKYENKEHLVKLLTDFVPSTYDMSNNGYLQYTPQLVMNKFKELVAY
jgi:glycosyltransferase involved in cell wall biosynthesis